MPKKRKKISERLIQRLRDEGRIPKNQEVYFRRHYPGYWQRSAGAWVWEIESLGNATVSFGSSHPATECLRAAHLVEGTYGSITPVKES